MKKFIFILACMIGLSACSSSSDDDNVDPPVEETPEYKAAESYYNNTLKSVITANCVSCHEGYHSKSNSSNYGQLSNAINNASGMFSLVNNGTMPKGGPKLPQEEIDKFEDFLELVNNIK